MAHERGFYYFVSAVTLQIPPLRCRKSEFFPLPMSFWRSTPSSLTAPSRFSARKPSVTCWSTHGPAICLNFKPQSRRSSPSETRQFLSRPSMRRRNRAGRMESQAFAAEGSHAGLVDPARTPIDLRGSDFHRRQSENALRPIWASA